MTSVANTSSRPQKGCKVESQSQGNICRLVVKITLIVLTLLAAAGAAALFFLTNVGTTIPAILAGFATASFVATVITFLIPNRHSSISKPVASTSLPSSINRQAAISASNRANEAETVTSRPQPPTFLFLLKKQDIIKEYISAAESGIKITNTDNFSWVNVGASELVQEMGRPMLQSRLPEEQSTIAYTDNQYKFQEREGIVIDASKMLKGAYILTKGPENDTAATNFWDMVWDSKTDIIVMATDIAENGEHKCSRYWNEGTIPRTFSSITVSHTTSVELKVEESFYTTRTFTLKKGTEEREVRQYHFHNWPCHDAHPSFELILRCIKAIDITHESTKPLIIHCDKNMSGRSGVFLVCHLLYQLHKYYQHRKELAEIDLSALVQFLHARPFGRQNAIQTEPQFKMLVDFGSFLQSSKKEK